jgi:hypothetical protein
LFIHGPNLKLKSSLKRTDPTNPALVSRTDFCHWPERAAAGLT